MKRLQLRLDRYRGSAELTAWFAQAQQRKTERAAAARGRSATPAEQIGLFPADELPSESKGAYRLRLDLSRFRAHPRGEGEGGA